MYEPINRASIKKKLVSIMQPITTSFGKNPANGGSPAIDNISRLIRIGAHMPILCSLYKSWIVLQFSVSNIVNTGIIKRQYIKKYIIHSPVLFIASTIKTHPRWPIEEYASKERRFDWFIPITPPNIAFILAKIIRNFIVYCLIVIDNKISGAIFCQVDKIKQDFHEIEAIIDGYQKWHGNAPSFIIIDIIRIINIGACMVAWFIMVAPVNIIKEPKDWTRKYLTAASVSWFDPLLEIIGMNLSILISNIIQAIYQFGLTITANVLHTIKIYIT